MKEIKLIIFDFDGVIEDNYEKHFELSSKEFRNLTREEHKQLFDGNVFVELEKLRPRNTGFPLPDNFNEHKITLVTKPEIKRCLGRLQEKYLLGIVSSARESGIKTYLERNVLTEYFSFVYGAQTSRSIKEKICMVKEQFHLSNKEIIFVTDTLGDIREANEAGILTIAVDFGFHERERLEKGNPVAIVSTFSNIEQEVERLS